jgi:sulfofructose kinase
MAGCAALGLRAAFLGATGSDAHGALVRDALSRRGVDLSGAVILDGPQTYSIILLTEGQGERIVLWRREPVRLEPVDPARFRLLHVDDIDSDAAIAGATRAREAGRLVTTDIDQATGQTKALIQAATHPILAAHVPGALTGEPDLRRALRLLRPLNAGPLVVTRGASGAVALDGDELMDVPGLQVDAVDTTGAGDVFRAGFIAALLDGAPLKDMLRFANAAAAISCTRRGAIASVPTRAEVERRLE